MTNRASDPGAAELAAGLLPTHADIEQARAGLSDLVGPSSWWRSGAAPIGDGRVEGHPLPLWRPRPDQPEHVDDLSAALDAAVPPPDDRGRPEFVRVRVDTEAAMLDLRSIGQVWSTPVVASFDSRGGLSRPVVWRWPLHVGVAGPDEWLDAIRAYWHHGNLYTAVPAVAGDDYEIVVVAVDRLDDPTTADVLRRATCVIGVGDGSAFELMTAVDGSVRPPIAVGVSASPDQWWVPFLETLTHDCPIDVAVDGIWRLAAIDAVVAGPEVGLDVTSPSRWLRALEADRPDLTGIADDIADWDWTSEGGGSTETSARARNVAAADGSPPVVVVDSGHETAMGEPSGAEPDESPPAPAPAPAPTPAPPGRFVHAVVDDAAAPDGERLSLVADRPNTLRCWIGPRRGRGAATSDPVPGVARNVTLRVELLIDRDVVDAQELFLPRDDRTASSECTFVVPSMPAGRFAAELAFTYEGRMYELVAVQADVVDAHADPAQVAPMQLRSLVGHRDVIDLDERLEVRAASSRSIDVTVSGGEIVVREFGQLGPGVYDLGGRRPLVDTLMQQLYATTKSLVRREVHGMAGGAGDPDPAWTELVRTMATNGWILHRTLHQQGFGDPGERFEVVNRVPDTYVPVELLYDRGAPAADAVVSPTCMAAMRDGADDCGTCHSFDELTDDERDANPTICPFGFWSLRKVIERQDPVPAGPGDGADRPASTVTVRSPDAATPALRPIDVVLAGWSSKVRDDDQQALVDGLSVTARSVLVADSWTSWREQLAQSPALLLALPHHDTAGVGSLEIRGDSSLGLQRALDTFVEVPDGAAPPILLLLGCESDGTNQLGHPSFAREFGPYASVVVGTLSKVLGRHAAPFAREFVTTLVAAQATGGDVGTVLRDVRRKMFADGYLMALGVIALGDAAWRLAGPTPDEDDR